MTSPFAFRISHIKSRARRLRSAFALAAPASAQWKPTQPIRVIIPYAAGGTSDIIARAMSDEVSKRLGQPFTIENRGGGATQIGTSAVAKARSRRPHHPAGRQHHLDQSEPVQDAAV